MTDTERTGGAPSVAGNAVVAELYAAWMERERRLDEHKKKVRAAVAAYAQGTGPDPTRLLSELQEMREDCNSVCASVVMAVKRARGQR